MGKSRSEQAQETLRRAILEGRFEPGAPLRYQELQELCGMSVTPVREALARLTQAGMVEGEHNRGYRVASVSLTELNELVSTRILVEGCALEEAIRHGDEHWEAHIISMYHVLDRLPRMKSNVATLDERWEARHSDFHAALISACGSKILSDFCRSLYERADRYRRFSISVEAGTRDVNAEHRAILDATLARDAGQARALLAEHYRNTAMLVRRHFEAQGRSKAQLV